MRDFMCDLETMGTGTTAAITAIGVVEFDIANRTIGRSFYKVVDLASSVRAGGVMDASTVMWWMKQSDTARAQFDDPGMHIVEALHKLSGFMENCCADRDDRFVWGNGATFDNVILGSAYDRSLITRPWEYFGDRCYRTIKNQHPDVKLVRSGTHHNALDDAMSQALHLIEMLNPVTS